MKFFDDVSVCGQSVQYLNNNGEIALFLAYLVLFMVVFFISEFINKIVFKRVTRLSLVLPLIVGLSALFYLKDKEPFQNGYGARISLAKKNSDSLECKQKAIELAIEYSPDTTNDKQ